MVLESPDVQMLILEKEIKIDELKLARKKQEYKLLQAKKEVERIAGSIKSSDTAISELLEEIEQLKNSN